MPRPRPCSINMCASRRINMCASRRPRCAMLNADWPVHPYVGGIEAKFFRARRNRRGPGRGAASRLEVATGDPPKVAQTPSRLTRKPIANHRSVPPPGKARTHAAKGSRKLGRVPTFGRNLTRVAKTSQSINAAPGTAGEARTEFAPRRAKLSRPELYFLARSALNISKPWAGLRFLCTTACTALIIACGASDWKMLRPMSTPAAPCWTAL